MTGASSWRLVDHTGDLAVLVRASTLVGIYEASVRALFGVILAEPRVEEREDVTVNVEGALDREDLLVRFLSELLFLHDARGWLFRKARVDELEPTRLKAVASGETFDPRRHRVARQVKAVTYHGLRLVQDAKGWTARIVLDL